MRYQADHKVRTRERIVDAASRGFRDRGLEGLGVAEVMAQIGLTHGGFYAHFADKEALIVAACSSALADARGRFERKLQRAPESAARALVQAYLAPVHRGRRADGCAIVALGSELARSSPAVRRAVARQLDGMLSRLSDVLPGRSARRRRDTAGLLFASLIGSLLLSRLLPDREGDRSLRFARHALARAVSSATRAPRPSRRSRDTTEHARARARVKRS